MPGDIPFSMVILFMLPGDEGLGPLSRWCLSYQTGDIVSGPFSLVILQLPLDPRGICKNITMENGQFAISPV